MRLSDERYRRDLRRLHVAWRMVRLGARTPTIIRWTSLSKYNVRKLRTEYGGTAVPREGLFGRTPFRIEFFHKTAKLRWEAALLAGLLHVYEALPRGPAKVEELPDLSRGERVCTAYEQFRVLCPTAGISFDRAITLLSELVRGELIRLTACVSCGELVVHDCLAIHHPRCASCWHEANAGLRPYREGSQTPLSAIQPDKDTHDIYHQQTLF